MQVTGMQDPTDSCTFILEVRTAAGCAKTGPTPKPVPSPTTPSPTTARPTVAPTEFEPKIEFLSGTPTNVSSVTFFSDDLPNPELACLNYSASNALGEVDYDMFPLPELSGFENRAVLKLTAYDEDEGKIRTGYMCIVCEMDEAT